MEFDLIAIGAANMDIFANVDQFPEIDDQVPVTSLIYAPGGSSANTAVALSKLGMKIGFLGKVGKDHNGIELIKAFQDVDVDTEGIIVDPSLPSGQTFIPVDKKGERMIFNFPGAPQALKRDDIIGKSSFLQKTMVIHLGSLRVVEPLEEAVKFAAKFNNIVSMNPGAINAARGYKALKPILDHVDVLLLSRRELDKLFGRANMEENARICFQETSIKLLGVTLGSRGSKYYYKGTTAEIEPVYDVPAVNTTGAGDAFAAGFLAKLLKTYKASIPKVKKKEFSHKDYFPQFLKTQAEQPGFFQDCLRYGNATAAFVVQGQSARANMANWNMVERLVQNRQ